MQVYFAYCPLIRTDANTSKIVVYNSTLIGAEENACRTAVHSILVLVQTPMRAKPLCIVSSDWCRCQDLQHHCAGLHQIGADAKACSTTVHIFLRWVKTARHAAPLCKQLSDRCRDPRVEHRYLRFPLIGSNDKTFSIIRPTDLLFAQKMWRKALLNTRPSYL